MVPEHPIELEMIKSDNEKEGADFNQVNYPKIQFHYPIENKVFGCCWISSVVGME